MVTTVRNLQATLRDLSGMLPLLTSFHPPSCHYSKGRSLNGNREVGLIGGISRALKARARRRDVGVCLMLGLPDHDRYLELLSYLISVIHSYSISRVGLRLSRRLLSPTCTGIFRSGVMCLLSMQGSAIHVKLEMTSSDVLHSPVARPAMAEKAFPLR